MPESLRQRLARARGWMIPAALLALAPKCVLCVLAYASAGAALGLGGPEFCGAPAGPWTWLLPVLGAALGASGFLAWNRRSGRARSGFDPMPAAPAASLSAAPPAEDREGHAAQHEQ
jgi:hypothetical protein